MLYMDIYNIYNKIYIYIIYMVSLKMYASMLASYNLKQV